MSAPTMTAEEQAKATQEANQLAFDAEVRRVTALAKQRGDEVKLDWLASNRVDDRVVLHDRNELHPGGECFVGGAGLDYCFHTEAVDAAIRSGEIVVVPEPKQGRARPIIEQYAGFEARQADMPGEPTRLGRLMNPDLFDEGQLKAIAKEQEKAPDEIPVSKDLIVAPEPPDPNQQNRQRTGR